MGEEKVKEEAMKIMGMFQLIPRLVVFDLDHTLWPFYCECRSKRDTPSMFPQAKGILYALKDNGVDVAVASKSPTPDTATTFLGKLGIQSLFVATEIFYTSHKTEHFRNIYKRTKIPFTEMLFFDDETPNIETVKRMGVTSILVRNGLTCDAFRQGLTEFSGKSKPANKKK